MAYEKYRHEIIHGIRGFRISPYGIGIDWYQLMTPIENLVWGHIRLLCLPLYPQFPIGKYFVDFGDPVKKIAVEVDSVRWHQDKAKDDRRQMEIEKLGWRFIRLPSWTTTKTKIDYSHPEGCGCKDKNDCTDWKRYFTESSEGILGQYYHKLNEDGEVVI